VYFQTVQQQPQYILMRRLADSVRTRLPLERRKCMPCCGVAVKETPVFLFQANLHVFRVLCCGPCGSLKLARARAQYRRLG
jgi:hypothetical protein